VQHLQKWAVQFNVSHACANEILKILKSTGIQVPKDIRTILHEYNVIRPILEVENGSYLDLGIYNIVQPHLVKEIDSIPNNITKKLVLVLMGYL